MIKLSKLLDISKITHVMGSYPIVTTDTNHVSIPDPHMQILVKIKEKIYSVVKDCISDGNYEITVFNDPTSLLITSSMASRMAQYIGQL